MMLPVVVSGWLRWNAYDNADNAVWNADNPLNNLADNSDYRGYARAARDTCIKSFANPGDESIAFLTPE